MSHHEECINAMWEEIEGKKLEYVQSSEGTVSHLSEEERWSEFVEKYKYRNYTIQSEFGIIDMSKDAMKDVANGEFLTYDEYLKALFNSRNSIRSSFGYCYYSYASCEFKGQISRFNEKKGKVIFKRIYISGMLMDGDVYEGKEDHVWMDSEPFKKYQVGDCLSFEGTIYRYLKTRNGKQIAFGIREPFNITKIEQYDLPTDDDMLMQVVDQIICETCIYHEHCYMRMCIADEEWREEMRRKLFAVMKRKGD